jgi:flagellar assembly protein FliH
MISLSRLIKSHWANTIEKEKKVISIKVIEPIKDGNHEITLNQTDNEKQAILENAKFEAEMLIQQATVHAEAIREKVAQELSEWELEKQHLAELARQVGYSEGLQEGREKGYQEYQDTILLAKKVVESSKIDYQLHIESSESTILELGIKAAEKILGKTLKENEEEFLHIVKRSLKEARDYREVQVHIHPNHYGFLLSQKDELMALFPKEIDLYIYPDHELSEESCIIESSSGRIDASIDVQLGEIKQKLIEILEAGLS